MSQIRGRDSDFGYGNSTAGCGSVMAQEAKKSSSKPLSDAIVLNRLDAVVQRAESLVAATRLKLSPILLQGIDKEASGCNAPREQMPPLFEALQIQTERIDCVLDDLATILGQVHITS